MKKSFIAIVFVLFLFQINAQNKPQKNTFGLGVDVSLKSLGSIPTFRLDYYLTNRHSIKLFYTPSYSMVDTESKDDNDDGTQHSSRKLFQSTYSMHLGLGYESHFLPKSKFDPFVGVNVAYIFTGKSKEIKEEFFTNNSSGIEERVEGKTVSIGVEKHGINSVVVLGANYFILKNLSLGAAFSLGYSFIQQKGEGERKSNEYIYEDDVLVSESNSINDIDVNYTTKGLVYSATIKAAYFFNQKKKKKS